MIPTDAELYRMVRLDQGDSYNMHFPDGTDVATWYTAEGPGLYSSEGLNHLRSLYTKWEARNV